MLRRHACHAGLPERLDVYVHGRDRTAGGGTELMDVAVAFVAEFGDEIADNLDLSEPEVIHADGPLLGEDVGVA